MTLMPGSTSEMTGSNKQMTAATPLTLSENAP
jgi:hypothetical protein